MDKPSRSERARLWGLEEGRVFLNHGSFGATPTAVRKEQRTWQDLMENEPVRFFEDLMPGILERTRAALAKQLSCQADDLALVENATSGVNTVLRSLVFERGDEILVPDHAYQACRNTIDFVAERWGATVVTVNIPFPIDNADQAVDAIMGGVTERTRLAMIDTVTSPTGLLMPFERLVAQLEGRNVEVLLDAAHGIGMIPLNLDELGASYTTSNCHKWLCAPKGSAFLHVRKDRQASIHPLTISHGMTFPLGDTTRFRHEFDWTGTRDMSAQCALPFAIRPPPGRRGGGRMARHHAAQPRSGDSRAKHPLRGPWPHTAVPRRDGGLHRNAHPARRRSRRWNSTSRARPVAHGVEREVRYSGPRLVVAFTAWTLLPHLGATLQQRRGVPLPGLGAETGARLRT